jgi:two-component system NtrC family sensor kinase
VRLMLLRPITEEMRYERRILEASKLAELGTIGSSIAHELNNPLGGMLSFLQLILMDLKPGEGVQPEIKAMEGAVLRCRDIVQNLLSFSRKQDLGELTHTDLWDVVEKSVKLIELQSKSKGILIELGPRASSPVIVSSGALSQALCNLLQNSIDAISEKLKSDPLFPGKIGIAVNRRDGMVQLTISDNGPGIRPEIQSQVFNPRFTTRDPEIYSGMGLTTAFTIVSDHHGSLEILSQLGSGTTAILRLHESSVASEKRH